MAGLEFRVPKRTRRQLRSRPQLRSGRQRGILRTELLESRLMLDGQLADALSESRPDPSAEVGTSADAGLAANSPVSATQPAAFGERFGSDEELLDWLIADAQKRWSTLFGREVWLNYPPPMYLYDTPGYRVSEVDLPQVAFQQSDAIVGGAAATADFSNTNVQVAGVGESDLVKTDGEHVFMLSRGELIVVDARDPESLAIVSRLTVPGWTQDMFLHDGRLTLVSTIWTDLPYYDAFNDSLPRPMGGGWASARSDFWGGPIRAEPRIQIDVIDVADPTSPRWVSTSQAEGTLVDTRSIGSDVYLVTQTGISLPEPRFECHAAPPESQNTKMETGVIEMGERMIPIVWEPSLCAYESEQQYVDRMELEGLQLALPRLAVSVDGEPLGADGPLVQAVDIYKPLTDDATSLLTVMKFDVSTDQAGPVSTTSLPGTWASLVYMTDASLYVLQPESTQTGILKFDLSDADAGVQLAATGKVDGRVLNQFSLDEFDGYLRIVVQEDWGVAQHTDLLVLGQEANSLQVVGGVEELAPGEALFSARFMGELAYIVTFGRQGGLLFDPLFTIDLSDPINPQVLGELEIPGFSNYLHPLDGGLILGVGYDVNPETGQRLAPQVSLFDVGDLEDPQLIDRFELSRPGAAAWTEVANDHHAFNYFDEQQILTVPVQISGAWQWSLTESEIAESEMAEQRSGLWVVRVDAESGELEPLGKISHDGLVRRSLRIGDVLVSISDDMLQAHPLLNPTELLSEVRFQVVAQDDSFELAMNAGEVPLDILRNDEVPGGTPLLADVTNLTTPNRGGSVRISDDGLQLLYTPAAGFVGIEQFRYTLSNFGGQDTGTVTVRVSPDEPQIAFDLRITDLQGNPLTSVEVGDTLLLSVYTQDVGELGYGVFAAYLDVHYDSRLASALGEIQFSGAFRDAVSAQVRPGLLDDVGAISGFTPLGEEETLVFQLELVALRPGLLTFQGDPADVLPTHDVLLYNVNFEIPTDWVRYGEASVVVVEPNIVEPVEIVYQNRQQPQDVNADGIVAPGDLLLVVNDLNQIGARSLNAVASPPTLLASELRQSEGESARRYYPDVNGDRFVSAADALVIINWLNDPSARIVGPSSNVPGNSSPASGPANSGEGESPVTVNAVRFAPTIIPAIPSAGDPVTTVLIGDSSTSSRDFDPLEVPTVAAAAGAGQEVTDLALGHEENLWPAGPLQWSELESLLQELAAGMSAATAGN